MAKFNPQTGRNLTVPAETVFKIAQGYREMLALVDTPVFKAKDRATQGMFHAQVNAVSTVMKEMLGGQEVWDRTLTVVGWDHNYLDMQKEAEAIPVGSEILRLPWEK